MNNDSRNMGEKELEEFSFSSGAGSSENPFVVIIPKNYNKEDMKRLLASVSGILLESVREDGPLVMRIEKE